MTREEVIESLENIKYINAYHRCREGIAIDKAIEALKEPNVSGWIPVSVRLPEEPNYYEVTVNFGSEQLTNTVYYSMQEGRWSTYENYVTAWRERLSEPYKAGEQECH